MKRIEGFNGPFRWLSNFWPCEIRDRDGLVYPSAEHAYQACKTLDPGERETIRTCATPGQAKRMGRQVTVRTDWDAVKLRAMERVLRKKFAHEELRQKLLATGDAEIVEVNTWGDTFWGVCNGVGDNHLGRLLMKVRGELQ